MESGDDPTINGSIKHRVKTEQNFNCSSNPIHPVKARALSQRSFMC